MSRLYFGRYFLPIVLAVSVVMGIGVQVRKAFAAEALPQVVVSIHGVEKPVLVRLGDDADPASVARAYAQTDGVAWAEPNTRVRLAATPNDPRYAEQWHLPAIAASAAWDRTANAENVIVAIIDAGVYIAHPDLAANVWTNARETAGNGIDDDANGFVDDVHGWDFVTSSSDPSPKWQSGADEVAMQHGTVAAGIIGAVGNNATGVAGAAWQVRLLSLRVLDHAGSGTTYDVGQAIAYAVARGAKVINLSLVGDAQSAYVDAAIKSAYDAGVVVVAAAGNGGSDGIGDDLSSAPQYPICESGGVNYLLGVGAVNQQSEKAPFSNYGSCVDVMAPGVGLLSTQFVDNAHGFTDEYGGGWQGTSFAAPMVSGAAALLFALNPSASVEQVQQAMLSTATSLDAVNPSLSGKLGRGLLDIAAAMRAAGFASGAVFALSPSAIASTGAVAADTQTIEIPKKVIPAYDILTAPASGGSPHVRRFTAQGKAKAPKNFYALAKSFRGGVSLASCDTNGDDTPEIIAAGATKSSPAVMFFSAGGKKEDSWFAYHSGTRVGVRVACGDLDGDGVPEVVTGAGPGGGPQVRIFRGDGSVAFIPGFFAYSKKFFGGIDIAVGDVDGDGKGEIITAPGRGMSPQVRIFDRYGKLRGSFSVFAKSFTGGVSVAAGDLDGDGKAEIVAGAGPGGGPQVSISDDHGKRIGIFFAFSKSFRGGVSVAAGDLDGDGKAEIVAGAGPGGGPQVRVFNGSGRQLFTTGFYAYAKDFKGGVEVGVISR